MTTLADDRPRVALLMPYYGGVSLGAARGLYARPTDGDVDVVLVVDGSSSLLPHTFNQLLCSVLSHREERNITHLAMLHSDIAPCRGWLDVLYREMRTHNADLMSAVSPIKDQSPNPRTSTAIGSMAEMFRIYRYVHMSDRQRLPVTFGNSDVCLPNSDQTLLVNTGCFLADLRKPWWDDFAFEFLTRIHRDPETGERIAEVCSEDWVMSRKFTTAGAKICATWAVPLVHHGVAEWSNQTVVHAEEDAA